MVFHITREVEAERIVLREPGGGRVRAVLANSHDRYPIRGHAEKRDLPIRPLAAAKEFCLEFSNGNGFPDCHVRNTGARGRI